MGKLQEVLGKRRATPASLSPSPSSSLAMFKIEVEEVDDGNLHSHKRVKELHTQQLQPPPSQDMHILDESSPLGLRLRKSSSFVKLIQMYLDIENAKKKEIKSRPSERVKASNFPASFLKIGTWEYTSQYEGDLVAKCYFAKHKLVWEVLDAGLKRKIEIQWSSIAALKATCPENGIGTLVLTLSQPPIFFKETDPQPRKHTMWQAALDFTDGQASMKRRHILQCPSSLLRKNFEKLIQCDQRLNNLSRRPYMILDSPGFGPKIERSIFENPNELKYCHDFSDLEGEDEAHLSKYTNHVSPSPCGVSWMMDDGMNDANVNQQKSISQPCGVSSMSSDGMNYVIVNQQQSFSQPDNLGKLFLPATFALQSYVSPSPCGVSWMMDDGMNDVNVNQQKSISQPCGVSSMSSDGMNYVIVNQQQSFSQPDNLGANDVDFQADVSQELKGPHPNSMSQLRSLSMDDLLSHLGDCIMEQKAAGNSCSLHISETSSKELLEDINQYLLSDSQGLPTSDEKCLMARVDSLLSLLEKDTVPADSSKFEPSDSGKIGVVEVNSDDFDEEISLAPDMETTNVPNPSTILRKDSYGELLSDLPRIASIPQSLFNILEDFDD